MTRNELERARVTLRDEISANGYGWNNGKYIKPPKKYRLEQEKLSCIDMINSILAYSCHGETIAENVLKYQESSYKNYLADYIAVLGRDTVRDLIQAQINDITRVKHCVYYDTESGYYNSIVWKDEKQ